MALDGVAPKKLSLNLQPPAPFDFVSPGTWPTWLSRYEDYAVVSGLTQASGDMHVRSLLYCMGLEARLLLETFSLDTASLASFQAVAASFTDHFVHPANEHYESSRFHRRVQLPGESVDAYYAELCRMVKRCNYPSAEFKVDSGAEVSAVPSDFPELPAKLDPVNSLLTGPGGQPLRVLGSYMARLRWHGKMSSQRFYVIQSLTVPLLGLPALQALEVVKFLDELQTPKETLRAELFQGLGTLKDEYTILLRPGAVPFSLSVPRRIPIPLREVVRHELDKLEEGGMIRRVDNPTPWCSGLVVVRKADGSYQLCVDLTQLNEVVLRDRHILPTVEQVIGLLGDATVFSKLDATASFHQVKLSADSQELTTFITPFGRYCFCRLPFGITSAPEYFQKQMARILEGQEGVAIMIDDILVFGRTREEHDARLSQVLSRLAKAGITLNQDKCRFGVSEVSFLGVIVSAQGIRPSPDKVEAIKAMEAPTDIAGVRRLLGMVNHLARFLPCISGHSSHQSTSKQVCDLGVAA
nr:uncharacterized protein LOC119165467 [Rhipicephalus microplus]